MSETVAKTESYIPFIEADVTKSAEELRTQMAEYGYLFFRALIPAEEVLRVRRAALEVLSAAGWLDPAHDLLEGVVHPGMEAKTEGMREYIDVYRQILRIPAFHNFPTNPALLEVAQKLLDHEAFVHPRRIGRITFPGSVKWTTPAHQDYYYIRGSVETYSCWTPLGDCPQILGGLAVWPGSHKRGYIEHTEQHPGAVGGRGVPVDESQAVWHTGDFGCGDALFFRSYTIHKALPNLTKNLLRLSTDNRYQVKDDAIDPSALHEHFANT
jgi:ectoine hydroxylase-related dioxygenase (phytanoyl-CoA dioxygenase family)